MADTRERQQWTLKHKALDEEFRALVRKAAERQGMQLMDYVVETLRARSLEILKGGGPPAGPPARVEDVADMLTARMQELADRLAATQAEALARIERDLAERRAEEQRLARRGRWRR